MKSTTPNALMEEWYAGIRINVLAHYECAKLFDRYHRALGYPTVILSALAGTAFVSTLNDSTDWWIKGVAIALSLTVTVLASLQTFLRYSERSEKHKTAATEFGKVRRELEEMIVLIPAGSQMAKADMDTIRTKWGDLSATAPSIPNRIYSHLQTKVEKGTPPAAPVNSTTPQPPPPTATATQLQSSKPVAATT